jgi:beta-lactamase superfamily II metal-dependent hydrolase
MCRKTVIIFLVVYLLALIFLIGVSAVSSFPPFMQPVQPVNAMPGACGSGSWVSGNLEIHHIDIGQADSTLIVGPTGRTLLVDAGEAYWNSHQKADIIGPYIEGVLGCKELNYVLITHFHLDHIGYVDYGGLWHLVEVQGFTVGQMLHRDYNSYLGRSSGTFDNWVTYLEGAGQASLHPILAVEGTGQVDLGSGVTFNIVTKDGNGDLIPGDFSGDASPPSENDYSVGSVLSYGDFDEWLGGDLDGQMYGGEFGYTYHDIETGVAIEVGDVDVYRVNHHGSDHSNNPTFVNQLDPEVSIISVGDGNTYGHPRQTVMDRLLLTSDVYMTERGDPATNIGAAVVAGDVVIKTSSGITYTVNGEVYTATEPLRTDQDGDGYFSEVDPDDTDPQVIPPLNGGCDPIYQICDDTGEDMYLPLVIKAGVEPVPTPTPTPTPVGTTGDVTIVTIFYDGSGSQEPDEYVEIRNDDTLPIQLHNWTLSDKTNHVVIFPSYVMQPGQTCRVYTNEDHPEWCGFNYGSGSGIWNNGEDCGYLRDANSTLLDEYCY